MLFGAVETKKPQSSLQKAGVLAKPSQQTETKFGSKFKQKIESKQTPPKHTHTIVAINHSTGQTFTTDIEQIKRDRQTKKILKEKREKIEKEKQLKQMLE